MSLNQNQVKDLVFADVTAAEAAGRPNEICYVQSLKTFYDYVVAGSAYTVNHTSILSTGNGGDTRWRARAGQYIVDIVDFKSGIKVIDPTDEHGVGDQGYYDGRYLAFDEIIQAATDTLTATECKSKQISNYGQSVANTQTLATAAKGMSGRVVIATAGQGAFHLKAGANDKIYLDGVALDDGDKVSFAVPAVGNFFSFFSFQNGASAYDWHVISGSGTVTDTGA